MNHKKLVLWVLLGLVGAAMLAGIGAVLVPSRFINDNIIITAVVVGLYGLSGLILVSIAGRQRWVFRISALSLAVSMVVFVFGIWADRYLDWRFMETIIKSGSVSLFLGLLFAHRLLIAPLRVSGATARVAKRTALISAGLLFLLGSTGLVSDGFWSFEEIGTRLLVISAIVVAGSTIATGAMVLFGPRPGEDEPGLLEGSIEVRLSCPRCDAPMLVRSRREARCGRCRLKVRVEVEEPRCACGYLLYQLESDTCPECGRAVSRDERWGARGDPAPGMG